MAGNTPQLVPKLDVFRIKLALARLYKQQRELQTHPNFPWIDEVPGYKFIEEEIDALEWTLSEIEADF